MNAAYVHTDCDRTKPCERSQRYAVHLDESRIKIHRFTSDDERHLRKAQMSNFLDLNSFKLTATKSGISTFPDDNCWAGQDVRTRGSIL
jgi:hypothetical protein